MTGKDVKTKLLASGYVLADIAKEMGIIPQTLNSLLQANDIKTGVLENIAKAINKSVYFFFEVADTSSDCSKSGIPYYDVDFCGGFDLVLNDQTYLPPVILTYRNIVELTVGRISLDIRWNH